ncbi:MAG: DNA mismatch repair protein MutS [Chloroflexi bacterium RBG_16_47_49]|nr:MAG: DNA mismatch repair protein MutS [Chloroflexi bacterium RBG_16_47_49]
MVKAEDITPIRKQYLEIKRQYPNAILFFRLGDFYETFDQDAEIAARELDIVLTSRPVGKGVRVPLAGIPHHAVENYLARLIERGFHVAICEQVGAQPIKGIFPREVVRVVTPGTLIESALLPPDANNYLVCVQVQDNLAGVAYVDISTGEFATTELRSDDIQVTLRAELTRLHPAEILYPDAIQLPDGLSGHLTAWQTWHFETARCQDALMKQFEVASLDGFGLRGMSLAIQAAGTIVQYLLDTQPAALKLLSSLSTYSTSEFMNLDASTRRNLELTETIRDGSVQGSLLGELDRVITPMGKRLIRQWVSKPLLDVEQIHQRQQGVLFFFNHGMLRAELRAAMKPLSDLERLTTRLVSGSAQPRDLVGMRSTLQRLPGIGQIITQSEHAPGVSGGEKTQPALASLQKNYDNCGGELQLLDAAIAEDPPATLQNTGVIKSGYSAELDGVIERSRHAREWIANLESIERKRTEIKTLKVGYNKIFGYYIEVTRANTEYVPPEYIRKQTLVNAERYITPEMKEYEALVLNAEESIHEIEMRIFRQVCDQLGSSSPRLLSTARTMAELDVLASLAEVAALGSYVLPEVVAEDTLEIHEGRHPVVENSLKGERFVTNDAIFEQGERIRILTGPNMSGKSTFLRQVALIVLMAQMGSFVPAASARIGLVDRIFTRIGAQDEIYSGQSTFMVEMVETSNILHHATNRSLLILDEIGRGTSTYDGVSIAWAVVEYIHNLPSLRAKTLFATHYHELTQLADLLPGVRNYNVAVSETGGRVVFLHKIIPGGADRSYGIHVGQLAGLPSPVVQRAEQILLQLEKSSGKAIKIDPEVPHQMALFPETNPLLEDLQGLDINALSPMEALNKLYEWKKKFLDNI